MQILKHVLFVVMLLASAPKAFAQTDDYEYWQPVMNAIIEIESHGNPNVRNGPYVGVMQISPTLVNSCNNILKGRGDSRRFTLNDRKDIEKSKQMFVIIQSHVNPSRDIEKACRIWAGGVKYTIKGTQKFVNAVRAMMKKQSEARNKK